MSETPHLKPLVSICIPAYRSQKFIAKVIDHALGQTVDDVEIIVSNDGGFETPDLDAYRAHPKVRIYDQRQQLGWVNNTNAALELARGAYFMVLPHDDLLLPTYVEECLQVLEDDSSAFAAYSDIEIADTVLRASQVRGDLKERIEHVMRNLFNGYSYRALMRRNPEDWPLLKLRENRPTNFCVDTTWILQQALFGELRRVPKALYLKDFHANTTHSKWQTLDADVLRAAWAQHCGIMGDLARARVEDHEWIEQLVQHRMDPRLLIEKPTYLIDAFEAVAAGQAAAPDAG